MERLASIKTAGIIVVFFVTAAIAASAQTFPSPRDSASKSLKGRSSDAKSATGLSSLPADARAPISAGLGKDDSGYWVRPSTDGFRGENPGQGLVAEFTQQGGEARSHDLRWGLETRAWGYGDGLHRVKMVASQASANRVKYRRDLVVAAELQSTVTQLRKESTSFNAELAAHEGPNSPNLIINTGPTPNDANGSPSTGNTSVILTGGPVLDCSPNCVPLDRPYNYKGATVTINDSVKGDSDKQEVLAHEIGHVWDARTNTDQYHMDFQTTQETKGKTPHDERTKEQRANQFKDQVDTEKKQWEKDHCHGFFHKTCK